MAALVVLVRALTPPSVPGILHLGQGSTPTLAFYDLGFGSVLQQEYWFYLWPGLDPGEGGGFRDPFPK
jgi:hypothetical protein